MTDSPPTPQRSNPFRRVLSLLFWIVLPLVGGLILSGYAIPAPAIGIVRVTTDIYGFSASFLSQQIQEARTNPRIRAVVVQIDSPGGEVTATQTMFFELQSLRQQMPVVSSIDGTATSGAFYAAMATDPVFAKPSSTVGNVGVWGYFPTALGVNDVVLASGPFKLTATNGDEFLREIEGVKQEFLATVASQRGERLKISSVDLSTGLAYPGREAQALGLVDFLGSQYDAEQKAAEMAGIAHYEVIDLEQLVVEKYYGGENPLYYYQPWAGKADPQTGERSLSPGLYLLYDVRLRRQP